MKLSNDDPQLMGHLQAIADLTTTAAGSNPDALDRGRSGLHARFKAHPFSTCNIDSQLWRITEASTGKDQGWRAVLERFEQHSPASVTARAALEQALPTD